VDTDGFESTVIPIRAFIQSVIELARTQDGASLSQLNKLEERLCWRMAYRSAAC